MCNNIINRNTSKMIEQQTHDFYVQLQSLWVKLLTTFKEQIESRKYLQISYSFCTFKLNETVDVSRMDFIQIIYLFLFLLWRIVEFFLCLFFKCNHLTNLFSTKSVQSLLSPQYFEFVTKPIATTSSIVNGVLKAHIL